MLGGLRLIMRRRADVMRRVQEMSKSRSLIIFARLPTPGQVKTRLITALGADGAARLQHAMTLHTLDVADKLYDVNVVVRFCGGSLAQMHRLYGSHRNLLEQGDGDLGARLTRAIDEGFGSRGGCVVVIGSDCPDLTADLLSRAFESLDSADLVIGPAHDGGYYLLGLSSRCPALFENIPWGSERVLATTLAMAFEIGLSTATLPTLCDIDRPEDLAHIDVPAILESQTT
jgi:rSAM/selenodomain-associated transferase 1